MCTFKSASLCVCVCMCEAAWGNDDSWLTSLGDLSPSGNKGFYCVLLSSLPVQLEKWNGSGGGGEYDGDDDEYNTDDDDIIHIVQISCSSDSFPKICHRYGNALNSQQLWTDGLSCVLQYSHYVLPAFILVTDFYFSVFFDDS